MIYQKLLEFQQQGIVIERDGENPHFRSSYATLNEVLSKVKGPLNALGIIILQEPSSQQTFTNLPTVFGLKTTLIDTTDNSKVECFMPYIGADTAQKLGSANTYNRRYSLITLLGLEDEDDDGNVASAPAPLTRARAKKEVVPEDSGITRDSDNRSDEF